jgi:hypothetical protein
MVAIAIGLALLFVLGLLVNIRRAVGTNQSEGTVASPEAETAVLIGAASVSSDLSASGGKFVQLDSGGTDRGASTCSGVTVPSGSDIQAVIDANPEGAALCVEAGTYRITKPLNPKNGQKLIGHPGAVLDGAKVISGFSRSGPNFVATGFLPAGPDRTGFCGKQTPACNYTQDVFLDGTPLQRVLSPEELGTGRYFEDFGENRIYLRDDPSRRLVEQAYATRIVSSDNGGITISNFVVEGAANPGQDGAIETNGRGGWVIQDNEVRYNHGVGIVASTLTMQGNKVLGNDVHHQGEMGLGGQGHNNLIEGNEISYNNTAGYLSGWECGGSKWTFTTDMVVRGNYSHDNNCNGMWTDGGNVDVTYENNVVTNNVGYGILHEISCNTVIRDNISMDNRPRDGTGFYTSGQIVTAASPNVEIYGNKVRGGDGIGFVQQDRPDAPPCPEGTPKGVVHDLYVHDNDITASDPSKVVAGGVADDLPPYTSRNNRFANNHYHLGDLSWHVFDWRNVDQRNTWSEWRSYGQDTSGTADTDVNRSAAPAPHLHAGPKSTDGPAGTATIPITVPSSDTYRISSRMMVPDGTNDSYALRVDNGPLITVGDGGIPSAAWTWVDFRDGRVDHKIAVNLSAGSHTLMLTDRENGVRIDQLLLVREQ